MLAKVSLRLSVTETPFAPCSVQKGTWAITSHLFVICPCTTLALLVSVPFF